MPLGTPDDPYVCDGIPDGKPSVVITIKASRVLIYRIVVTHALLRAIAWIINRIGVMDAVVVKEE